MRHQGTIKTRYPTFGFIVSDTGLELFFLPTSVNRDICPFKQLEPGYRVEFVIIDHPRGLRADDICRVTTVQSGLADASPAA